ncbi:MAG: hypothetical protein H6722_30035 [Sandaracinus sp.]|nr:hypothetical protein [Sandaracinus sp.]MCB9604733.1 hypothetical protein [Sandaracinus sp.]MCB9616697.1 hypothetical protein [Sandaracinus sp.]
MKRWLLALALVCSVGSFVAAQDEPTADPAEDPQASRASSFRAVSGPQAERVPGGTLTVVAYGAAWLVMLGYLWRLGRMHAHNADELTALRKSLEDQSA